MNADTDLERTDMKTLNETHNAESTVRPSDVVVDHLHTSSDSPDGKENIISVRDGE